MSSVSKFVLAAAAIGMAAAASPTSAAVVVVGPGASAGVTTCANWSFTGATEVACAGGYNPGPPGGGNLLQGTLQDPGLAAITSLGYVGTGAYLGSVSISGSTLTFTTALSGLSIIGIHYGGAGDPGGEATSFFSFLAAPGTTSITVTSRPPTQTPFGLSNVQLFSTNGRVPVPEPATWAMMLLGFGGIGLAMRRSRKLSARALPQLA